MVWVSLICNIDICSKSLALHNENNIEVIFLNLSMIADKQSNTIYFLDFVSEVYSNACNKINNRRLIIERKWKTKNT